MRFYGFAVAVGVITMGACAGGEKKPADTTHVAVDTSSTTTTVSTSSTTPAPAGGAVAMAPITGATKTVNMVGDAKGYRFEPANFTIKEGDGVKFVVDGSIQGYTGLLGWPNYYKTFANGVANISQDDLSKWVLEVHKRGFQAVIHTNADQATEMARSPAARGW